MRFFELALLLGLSICSVEAYGFDRILEVNSAETYFNHLEKNVRNIREGRDLIKEWIDLIESQYEISVDIKNLQYVAISLLDEYNLEPSLRNEIENILWLLSESKGSSAEINGFRDTGVSLIKNSDEQEEDYPTTMIVGGVEVFAGALLHLVPYCSTVGKFMIGDGLRRIFDGVEEKDQEIRDRDYRKSNFLLSNISLSEEMLSF